MAEHKKEHADSDFAQIACSLRKVRHLAEVQGYPSTAILITATLEVLVNEKRRKSEGEKGVKP